MTIQDQAHDKIYAKVEAIKQEITEFMLFIINILRSNKFSDRELAKVVSENVSVMMSNIFDC